ncbi:hypothetical protein A4A49_54721 [Nicotiana attenuata]|uniref:Uncharacterized protein n=1 Tax=Nicotiana attenuata TaxID=49451 RepID=A0A314LG08_NICAT|nr:hypothetical protein A4A49_54721 [Nicotiana attenuata]
MIHTNMFSNWKSSILMTMHNKGELLCGATYVSENLIEVIDMDRSGATIAYDYFKEKLINGDNNRAADVDALEIGEFDRVRRLFEYIEDRDLWR